MKAVKKNWMFYILLVAGAYNILWGAYVVFFPWHFFEFLELPALRYPELWQCIGMIVGVYGVGYIAASYNPLRHWPIVLVGLLGKIFGPIGLVWGVLFNEFPLSFGATIITNDLIWWPFFFLILKKSYDKNRACLPKVRRLAPDEWKNFESRKRAKLINSVVGIKSCSLLGSCDSEGRTNLCIVSSVVHLGASPALLGVVFRPDTVVRDTLENIRKTGYFTLNHVQESFMPKAHQTSARYPSDVSEFDQVGLTSVFSNEFKAPFVEESVIRLGLKMVREVQITENGTHFVVAEIEEIYLNDELIEEDGNVDLGKAQSLAVAGLDSYHRTERIGRMAYAKADTKPAFLDI